MRAKAGSLWLAASGLFLLSRLELTAPVVIFNERISHYRLC